MKNIEAFKVSSKLSALLVNIESQLKSQPDISLKDFCNSQEINPIQLLYTIGFQALITFGALVPLKEVLDRNDNVQDWDKLRTARNSLCHGTYEFCDNDYVKFKDQSKELILSFKEIVELSNKAFDAYMLKTQ